MENIVHLVDASVVRSPVDISREAPELWRLVRRFNLPAQLALLAAHRVAASAEDPSSAALVSVAPCRGGSRELDDWLERALPRSGADFEAVPRMNPVLTLHVVDNLALSGFAIHFGNRAYCLGLGGAPGQAWAALESTLELLGNGGEHTETIVMAGDRVAGETDSGLGVAMLFSTRAREYTPMGFHVRFLEVAREAQRFGTAPLRASSSQGLALWLGALAEGTPGFLDFVVPAEDGDSLDQVTVRSEIL